jgi:DNA-binding response OmpR family regulator
MQAMQLLLPDRTCTQPLADARAPSERPVLTVWADDWPAALAWQATLLPEGVGSEQVDTPRSSAGAHLLFINGALSSQLARLRQQRQAVPALPLMVACRGLRDLDQVLALEIGADDVVDTTASPPVVAARLRALWRRQSQVPPGPPALPSELCFGTLRLLSLERQAVLGDRRVPLSEGEFEVLWLLASQAGRAVSRSELLRRVRGLENQPMDRSIDSRVYRIRAKLGDVTRANARIRTVRNFGYAFSPRDW